MWITLCACSHCSSYWLSMSTLSVELTPCRVGAVFIVQPPCVLPKGAVNLELLLVRRAICVLLALTATECCKGCGALLSGLLSCLSDHCFHSGSKAFETQTLKRAYKLVYWECFSRPSESLSILQFEVLVTNRDLNSILTFIWSHA